ncbi:DNA polymerase III subunit beta [bacterium]|nr:DNA polymerase III subunit beta [bacterium]MCK4597943.1 DNA polymerase III subunit beta [bacterium]
MKFSVNRTEFFPAVQAVYNVVSPKATLPIISNILFRLEGEKLALYATDLDISIRTQLIVSSAEDGSVTLPAKKLVELVRELPDTTIQMNIKDKKATMTCEKGNYQLTGMDSDEFPAFPEAPSGETFKISQSALAKMIHKTLYCISKDETRPALQGVFWQIEEKKMSMVATDGHRLAKIVMQEEGPDKVVKDVIVPAKALNQILRLFGEQDEDVEVCVTENQIIFSLGNTTLYSRLIEGPYPDYTQVIPKEEENDKSLIVNREQLLATIRRVSTLSNSLTHQVKFNMSPGNVQLCASDRDLGGEAKDDLKAEYSGKDIQIGYNSHYIIEILKNIDSEKVTFELSTAVRACLVKPFSKEEDYLCLIMPLRLTEETKE